MPVRPSSANQYSDPPDETRLEGLLPTNPGLKSTISRGVIRDLGFEMSNDHTSSPVVPLVAAQAIVEEFIWVRKDGLELTEHKFTSPKRTGEAEVFAGPGDSKSREYNSVPYLYPIVAEKSKVEFFEG